MAELEEAGDDDLLKLFEHCPLLLHSEMMAQGACVQAQLERWIAQGKVGSRTLKPGVMDSSVYWRKRNTKDPVRAISAKLKRAPPKFISPLLDEASPIGPKRPRLAPSHNAGTPIRGGEGGTHDGEGDGERKEAKLAELNAEKRLLEKELKEKEDKLSKLKLVQLYRSKNDLLHLDSLISKWRQVSQEAAETLQANSCRNPAPSMGQLLDYLHIDHTLIRYSAEQESFY